MVSNCLSLAGTDRLNARWRVLVVERHCGSCNGVRMWAAALENSRNMGIGFVVCQDASSH